MHNGRRSAKRRKRGVATRITPKATVVLALIGVLLLLPAVGLTASLEAVSHLPYGEQAGHGMVRSHKERARPTPWVVLGRPRGNRVRIGRNVGWCPERGRATRPRITGVQQVNQRRSVVLTALMVQHRMGHCAAVESLVERLVHIRGGLRGRPLYDGSQSPPVRRWPRKEREVRLAERENADAKTPRQ